MYLNFPLLRGFNSNNFKFSSGVTNNIIFLRINYELCWWVLLINVVVDLRVVLGGISFWQFKKLVIEGASVADASVAGASVADASVKDASVARCKCCLFCF